MSSPALTLSTELIAQFVSFQFGGGERGGGGRSTSSLLPRHKEWGGGISNHLYKLCQDGRKPTPQNKTNCFTPHMIASLIRNSPTEFNRISSLYFLNFICVCVCVCVCVLFSPFLFFISPDFMFCQLEIEGSTVDSDTTRCGL